MKLMADDSVPRPFALLPPGMEVPVPADRWVVLPNLRLGLPLTHIKAGRKVYLAADGITRLCEHGQTVAYISKWRGKEGAECPCKNTDGLNLPKGFDANKDIPQGWTAPEYFDVLVANKTEEITLQGDRKARRIPYTGDTQHAVGYMTASGSIRCEHGNSATTLRAFRSESSGRKFIRKCNCVPGAWQKTRLQTRREKKE